MRFKRVYVEITNICNLNCSFCPPTKKPPQMMSVEQFTHIASQLPPYTEYIYLHIKGEPLLHKNLKEILDVCKRYNLMVNLTTNGTLLADNIKLLTTHNAVRQINLSLHSLCNRDENYIAEYMKNVALLFDNRGDTPPYIQLRLWTIKDKDDRYIKLIAKNLASYSGVLESDILNSIQVGSYFTLMPRVFLDYDKEFVWPSLDNEYISDTGKCYGLISMIGILCDGTVVPCCLDGSGDLSLGNIFITDLCEIIESKAVKEFTQNMKYKRLTGELCKRCGYRLIFDRGVKGEVTDGKQDKITRHSKG